MVLFNSTYLSERPLTMLPQLQHKVLWCLHWWTLSLLSSMFTVVNTSPIPASSFLSADLWCVLLHKDISVPLTFRKRYNTCSHCQKQSRSHLTAVWTQPLTCLSTCGEMMNKWKCFFFLFFDIQSVQLLMQTPQTSLVTEAKGRLSMGESASRTCLRSNCTQPTCPAASYLIFCSPVVMFGEFSLLQEW